MTDAPKPTLEDLIKMVEAAIETDSKPAETVVDTSAETRAFAEATNTELETIKAQLAAQAEKNAMLERQLELQVVSQTLTEIHSFSDNLVAAGKLPPALKDRAETLLGVVANLEGDVKSYALNDSGEDGEKSVFALVSDLLSSLPVNTLLKPINKSGKDAESVQSAGKGDFRRFGVDQAAADDMHERIKSVQKEKGLSYMAAFETVKRESLRLDQ